MLMDYENTCYLCNDVFTHKRYCNRDGELKIVVHCRRCRIALRRRRRILEMLTEIEWEIYGLGHHPEYFRQ